MSSAFDITDVPSVSTVELAIAVRQLIGGGKPLANAANASEADFRDVEDALWRRGGVGGRKLAVAIRLRALVAALGSRRVARLMGEVGYGAKLALIEAAAELRLNGERGFMPQHLVWALTATATAPEMVPVQTARSMAA